MGGFSSVFHAIQSRYGWSDDTILDLRISRLVQMIHVIQETTLAEINLRRAELTWQTRAICSFLANTIEDEKARNTMVKRAEKLTLLDDEDDHTPADTSSERSLEDIMENGSVAAALANNDRKGLDSGMLGRLAN